MIHIMHMVWDITQYIYHKRMVIKLKKKYLIMLLLFIAVGLFAGYKTYSYYVSKFNVTVKSEGSNIICDAEIESVPDSEKNIFGYSEFKVVVKNYDSSNNLTKEPFKYVLTFEGVNSPNVQFGYNNLFPNNLSINGTLSNDANHENSYTIQVKSSNGLSENVNYKAKLKCTQIN